MELICRIPLNSDVRCNDYHFNPNGEDYFFQVYNQFSEISSCLDIQRILGLLSKDGLRFEKRFQLQLCRRNSPTDYIPPVDFANRQDLYYYLDTCIFTKRNSDRIAKCIEMTGTFHNRVAYVSMELQTGVVMETILAGPSPRRLADSSSREDPHLPFSIKKKALDDPIRKSYHFTGVCSGMDIKRLLDTLRSKNFLFSNYFQVSHLYKWTDSDAGDHKNTFFLAPPEEFTSERELLNYLSKNYSIYIENIDVYGSILGKPARANIDLFTNDLTISVKQGEASQDLTDAEKSCILKSGKHSTWNALYPTVRNYCQVLPLKISCSSMSDRKKTYSLNNWHKHWGLHLVLGVKTLFNFLESEGFRNIHCFNAYYEFDRDASDYWMMSAEFSNLIDHLVFLYESSRYNYGEIDHCFYEGTVKGRKATLNLCVPSGLATLSISKEQEQPSPASSAPEEKAENEQTALQGSAAEASVNALSAPDPVDFSSEPDKNSPAYVASAIEVLHSLQINGLISLDEFNSNKKNLLNRL